MDYRDDSITTLMQLVDSVSAQTNSDAETVHVVGRLLNSHRFVLAGGEPHSTLFEHRLANLPATN